MLLLFIGITSKGGTLDTILKTTILGTLCFYIFFKAYRERIKININSFFIWFLYIISQLVTLIININETPPSMSSIISKILYPAISIFVFIILLKKEKLEKKDLVNFLNLFVGAIVFMCIYNLYTNWFAMRNIFAVSSAYGNEMRSFLDSNHVFGFYIFIGIISCLVIINQCKKKQKWYYFIIVFLAFNLITTFSRTSTMSLIIFILLMSIQNANKKGLRTLMILGTVILLIFSIPPIEDYVIKVFFKLESGLSHRDEIYAVGWNIFKSGNILFGNGYDNPIEILRTRLDRGGFHNTYISLLAYGGIVMFSFFIGLIVFSLKIAMNIKKHDKFMGSVFLSLIISILSYSVAENMIFFFSSATYFIATCFCILIPLYYRNYLMSKNC
jgi:hypothetical protein